MSGEVDPEEIINYYFAPDGIPESVIGRYMYPAVGLLGGYIGAIFGNYCARRPIFSGIQKHILLAGGFCALGEWIYRSSRKSQAERDAVLKHYISLHPEDFIPEKRVKYKDVFQPWTPIR